MVTIEIKLKIGSIKMDLDEAKELYEKLETFFKPIKLQPEKFVSINEFHKERPDYYA